MCRRKPFARSTHPATKTERATVTWTAAARAAPAHFVPPAAVGGDYNYVNVNDVYGHIDHSAVLRCSYSIVVVYLHVYGDEGEDREHYGTVPNYQLQSVSRFGFWDC